MKNDEEKADKGMTNGSRTRFFQRQQKIHDAPRVQHPRWVEPISPTYQSYESRLAELLGLSSHRKRSERPAIPYQPVLTRKRECRTALRWHHKIPHTRISRNGMIIET
jgi:hypothetical protein